MRVNHAAPPLSKWRRPVKALLWLFRIYTRLFHRITVSGLEHYPPPDEHAVILPNHFSLADGWLLAAYLPGEPVFVVERVVSNRWWSRPILARAPVIRVDSVNPFAVRTMIQAVREGRRLVLFPEGRISVTGGLMKMYDGAGMIADNTGAKLVPVRIEGSQFSVMSYLGGKVRRAWFPRLSITILPPISLSLDPALPGRWRRQLASQAVQDVMVEAAFVTRPLDRTLFSALVDAAKQYGWRMPVLRDAEHELIDYHQILTSACVLGRALTAHSAPGEVVGLLLPNAIGAVATFMALQAFGRVPAMLNVTTGAQGMLSACRTARVRLVISSRQFAERGRLEKDIQSMAGQVTFLWLEDLRGSLGWRTVLRGWCDTFLTSRLPGRGRSPDDAAVVMFTSGTEGTPKGVVLSHRNILANCAQAAAVIDFTSADLLFNALPMFHAFGLTVGMLLPLLSGVPTFLYPTPLHYRLVPEMIYSDNATIVLGTDTFLAGWARFAHPYDFRSTRFLVAGGERLKEATRKLYAERFGVRILEGYGATETAPVLSINTPLRNAAGSAGHFLPGIASKIETVEGLDTGGRLWVRGPNVMLGYLRASAPGVLEPAKDGWYDTGDIVEVDSSGLVWIKDRAKRFAKLGGELVPMSVGEALAERVWPDATHAVVALPDAGKGERLVLVTSNMTATLEPLLAAARTQGMPVIMVPRTIRHLQRLPRLGTGKTDYPAVRRLVDADLVTA